MDDWKLEPAHDLGLPPAKRAQSLQREAGLLATGGHLAWWALVRSCLGIYHRLRIQGAERIPRQPPFVIISNHASHLDALVLAAPLPWRIRDRIFPIGAGDVFFETPAAAFFSAGMINALPMWRRNCGAHAMESLRARLVDEPCAYILFPEGTRSRNGAMGSFKAGLGMLVAATSVPVVPCHLEGTFQALPPGARFPRHRRITLRVGQPMCFRDVPNNHRGWNEIARRGEAGVRALSP